MNDINGREFTFHLSENQLVDYVQQGTMVADLQMINSHLIECSRCTERLYSLILFAAENQLLRSEQEKVVDQFLKSRDYDLLKGSFISRAIEPYKRKSSRLFKRITGISLSFSFNIRLTS